MKTSPLAALTAILAALLVLGAGGPALAHDALKSSNPAKGAAVEALDEVELEFTAKVRMPFVIVRGPGDTPRQAGEPQLDGKVVTQAVKGPLPDGKYTIAYRVVSSDGHPIEGEIPFTVKGAKPSASPEPSGDTSPSAAPSGTGEATLSATSAATGGAPSAPAAQSSPAADQASATQDATFPVWLIVVIGGLVGIGIGFLLSARRRKP
ncbi:copper resistance CopC family protein [Nonomuraea sp. 3N208]|uniref:copper resistance CopC family protein n=1 Tax=Nonomuraea sp. 3N208 TaxID=3457421 RepID=UPI003FD47FBE